VARGLRTPSSLHLDAWDASIAYLAAKTKDQMRKDVGLLVDRFDTLEAITAQDVRRWVDELGNKGASPSSIKRMVSFWRSYWRYLVSIDVVPLDRQPFATVTIRSLPRTTRPDGPRLRRPMSSDIVGHEKPRITNGLYSGGASLATKAAALELVKYPST